MQFSFPSVSNVAAPKPSDASAANTSSSGSASDVAGGFADLLAGAANAGAPGSPMAPVANGAARPPAGAAPAAAVDAFNGGNGVAAAKVLAAATDLPGAVAATADSADAAAGSAETTSDSAGATPDANGVRQGDLLSMMMALWAAGPNSPSAPLPDATGSRIPTTGTTATASGGVATASGEPTSNPVGGVVGQGPVYARFDLGARAAGVAAPVIDAPATSNPALPGKAAVLADALAANLGNVGAVPSPAGTVSPNATVTPGSTPAFTAAATAVGPSPADSAAASADKSAATAPLAGTTIPAVDGTAPAPVVTSTATASLSASAAATLPPDSAATVAAAASVARGARRVSGVAEKFAVPAAAVSNVRTSDGSSDFKSMLLTKGEAVKSDSPGVGISAAKTDATMPAGSTLERPSPSDTAAVLAPHAASDAKSDAGLPASVALPTTAHRAVEAVLSATERFAAREQSSVTLRFSVGNNDLNVRVEMRAGEVHTTFRTDSPELRAALSAEWQSSTSNGDRGVRLAPPVFASSNQQGMSSSGEGASRQRDQQASQSSPGFTFTSTRPNGSSSAPTGNTAATATTPAARPVTSRHLQTLA